MSWSNGAIDDDVLGGDLSQREFQGGMARISGKLLNANLLRDGYNLSISNTAVSTPTLYLDVTNRYVGLKTSSPAYALDAASAVNTTNAIATSQLNAANLYASADTIYSLTGNINIRPNGGGIIIMPRNDTANLSISSSTISSKSNSDINLTPTGPLAICLSVTITGSSTAGANKTYTRSSGGTTQFTSDGTHYIIWNLNSANPVYNTLSPARWLLFDTADNAVPLYQNLGLDPSSTGWGVYPAGTLANISASYTFTSTLGTTTVNAPTTVSGDLTTNGNITVSGNLQDAHQIILGDAPMDTVVIGTDLNQTLVPNLDSAYDIGSSSYRWANLFTPDVTKANNLLPTGATVNSQIFIDGGHTRITSATANADVTIGPNSGISHINSLVFNGSTITNTTNDGFIYSDTGSGYSQFVANDTTTITATGGVNSASQYDNISSFNGLTNIIITGNNGANTAKCTINGSVITITDPGFGYPMGSSFATIGGSTRITISVITTDILVGGMILPVGSISQRPSVPNIGDTRYNTELQYLECFNGSIYIVSTGPSPITTAVAMEDYSQIWDLILG